MANKKITKREVINAMLSEELVRSNADYKAYLENELRLLDNKKGGKKSESKNAKENKEIIAPAVLDVLRGSTEILANKDIVRLVEASTELELSTQRLTPILTKLVNDKEIFSKRTTKGIRYSAVPFEEEEATEE